MPSIHKQLATTTKIALACNGETEMIHRWGANKLKRQEIQPIYSPTPTPKLPKYFLATINTKEIKKFTWL